MQANDWQVLSKEATFTTDGGGSYNIDNIATDYYRPIFTTEWDRTNYKKIQIVSPQQWQALKGGLTALTGIYRYARVRGDSILMNPDNAGDDVYFEYISKNYVKAIDGSFKSEFTTDTDGVIFDEKLVELGLKYYLKNEDGLPAENDAKKYYSMLNNLVESEKPRAILRGLTDFTKSKFVTIIPDVVV